jgi:hypothetical protein
VNVVGEFRALRGEMGGEDVFATIIGNRVYVRLYLTRSAAIAGRIAEIPQVIWKLCRNCVTWSQ